MTVAVTARAFLRGQLDYLGQRGWDVHLLCGEAGLDDFAESENVEGLHVVPADRNPSLRDPLTALGLWWLLCRVRPLVVVFGTPKMGVLGTIAARFARVPVRIYLMHGHRAEGLHGIKRRIMTMLERVACKSATQVIAVSDSVARRLEQDGVAPAGSVAVLGPGSANGIDLQRFQSPTNASKAAARRSIGIPTRSRVVACVGRLTRDKGLTALPALWSEIARQVPDAHLVIAGAPELKDASDRESLQLLEEQPRVKLLGPVTEIEKVYHAADVLVHLSRREGLPTVVLEAAACGVPSVAWGVTGMVDAVIDGRTGLLITPNDERRLIAATVGLLSDDAELERLGSNAAARVIQDFEQGDVWERWSKFLERSTSR